MDAFYDNGAFYAVTYAKSNKMLQIADNPQTAVAGCTEMFTGDAVAENLGWVLKPEEAG